MESGGGECDGIGFCVSLVHEDPLVRYISNFMTREECDTIISTYSGEATRSTVVGEFGNMEDDSRTSSTAFLPRGKNGDLLERVERRASLFTGIRRQFLESLQLVRYRPGERYLPHHDYFETNGRAEGEGNRTFTLLVYLNDLDDCETHGHTEFTEIGIKVQPKAGAAVAWSNCQLMAGKIYCDSRTLHSGNSPEFSIKYALPMWFRSTVMDASL